MLRWLLRWFGFRMLRRAVVGGKRPPLLDFGLGFALLKDRRVPLRSKGTAVLLGCVATAALIALELPVEALIALLFNVPGLGLDFAIDGLEAVAGPLLFGALLIPRLAPRGIVDRLRAERYGLPPQPAYAPPPTHGLLRRG